MAVFLKARCEECGAVYEQNELVKIVKRTRTVKRIIRSDVQEEYWGTELRSCPTCGHDTYEVILCP